MIFLNTRNKSVIGAIFTEDRKYIEAAVFGLNNVFVPFGAFAVIIVCTVVLVVKLRGHSKWRQMSTGTEKNNKLSNRDQRITKVVVAVSILFIVCFVPCVFAL